MLPHTTRSCNGSAARVRSIASRQPFLALPACTTSLLPDWGSTKDLVEHHIGRRYCRSGQDELRLQPPPRCLRRRRRATQHAAYLRQLQRGEAADNEDDHHRPVGWSVVVVVVVGGGGGGGGGDGGVGGGDGDGGDDGGGGPVVVVVGIDGTASKQEGDGQKCSHYHKPRVNSIERPPQTDTAQAAKGKQRPDRRSPALDKGAKEGGDDRATAHRMAWDTTACAAATATAAAAAPSCVEEKKGKREGTNHTDSHHRRDHRFEKKR